MKYAPNGLHTKKPLGLGNITGGQIEAIGGAGMIAYGAVNVIGKVSGRKKAGAVSGTILDLVLIGAGFWLVNNSGISFSQIFSDIENSSIAQAVGL